jgi:hypothetical protein
MASTATTRLRLEKMADGENDGTWGPKMTAVLDRVDEAVAGSTAVATTGGTTTLTSNNFTSDEARAAILEVTGTLASNATIRIPAVSKLYVVDNSTSGSFTVTVEVSGGTGAVVTQGEVWQVKCDGTDCVLVGEDTVPSASDTVAGLIELAVQSEMETGTSVVLAVTPGRQHFHPGHVKAWANIDLSGSQALNRSHGITSVADGGTGTTTITLATAFSDAEYGYVTGGHPETASRGAVFIRTSAATKSTTQLVMAAFIFNDAVFTAEDSTDASIAFFGDL